MRNTQVAEWILSLVTSPDRAASTVGDLMEGAARRGAFWFWLGVLRTALSMLWRDFSDDPARTMGLAIRGLLLEIVMLVAFVICAAFLGGVIGGVWYVAGTVNAPHPVISSLGWMLAGVVAWGLIPFQIGRWLARRSPGRELAPCVGFMLFDLVTCGIGLIWGGTQSSLLQFLFGLMTGLSLSVLLTIPLMAGAALVRRKRMSH